MLSKKVPSYTTLDALSNIILIKNFMRKFNQIIE